MTRLTVSMCGVCLFLVGGCGLAATYSRLDVKDLDLPAMTADVDMAVSFPESPSKAEWWLERHTVYWGTPKRDPRADLPAWFQQKLAESERDNPPQLVSRSTQAESALREGLSEALRSGLKIVFAPSSAAGESQPQYTLHVEVTYVSFGGSDKTEQIGGTYAQWSSCRMEYRAQLSVRDDISPISSYSGEADEMRGNFMVSGDLKALGAACRRVAKDAIVWAYQEIKKRER